MAADSLVIVCAVFGPLSVLAVFLRFVARGRSQSNFSWDDWFAAFSLIFLAAYIGSSLWADMYVAEVSGPPQDISLDDYTAFLKATWLAGFWSPSPITCAKFSLLYLYWRIFSADPSIRRAIHITGVLCLVWWIVATICVACECIPVQKAWQPELDGYCFNYANFLVGIEVPNTLIDFWMIGMAAWELKKLQLSTRNRIALLAIFSLGGFVGIVSIVRMGIVYNGVDESKFLNGNLITVQLSSSVICCCLPVYRSLLPKSDKLQSWFGSLFSLVGRRDGSYGSQTQGYSKPRPTKISGNVKKHSGPYSNLSDGRSDGVTLTTINGQQNENDSDFKPVAGRDYPMNSFKKTQALEVV